MSAARRVASCLVACAVLSAVPELCAQTPPPPAKAKDGFAGKKAGEEWDGNGLKMKFCWCPAGKFTMGSPKSEPEHYRNEDQVEVTLSRGSWLGKYEATQGEWEEIMRTTIREQRDKVNPMLRKDAPLFRTVDRRGQLTDRRLSRTDAWAMLKSSQGGKGAAFERRTRTQVAVPVGRR